MGFKRAYPIIRNAAADRYGVTMLREIWDRRLVVHSLLRSSVGLCGSRRMGEIDHNEFLAAKQLAADRRRILDFDSALGKNCSRSMFAAGAYPLSAADALQLAAALEWCEGKPRGNVFLTFDRRLREAAELAGFTLE